MSLPEDVPQEDVTGLWKRQALALGASVRVRQCAVVGAALLAAWAGGTGIASATEDTTPVETGSSCEAPLPTADDAALLDTVIDGEGTGEGDHEGDDAGNPVSPEPCDSDVTVEVAPEGDCLDPETFTFVVNATGLDAGVTYTLVLGSDDIVPAEVPFTEEIKADEAGKIVDYTFTETEGDAFTAPSTGVTFGYILIDGIDTEWPEIVGGGEAGLDACEPVVPAEPTHPAAPTTTPAPATTVAPVVVTHPAAAQPAVLANTGTPVAAAALLCGGLLVAGAGALVATRRRAS